MSNVDYCRLEGLIDRDVMKNAHVAVVGVGGASSLVRNLAHVGLGAVTIIDFDEVSTTNVATQAYGLHQAGKLKVEALEADIRAINPDTRVTTHAVKLQGLSESALLNVLNADLLLAMTDNFYTQATLNKLAIRYEVDTLFSGGHEGCKAVEITGTFAESIERGYGCHRCHIQPRYDAHAQDIVESGVINSHIFQAEYRNAMLGTLALSVLHDQKRSPLGQPHIARLFKRKPFLIGRIDPHYFKALMGPADHNQLPTYGLFSTKSFERQLTGSQSCPDCGTPPNRIGVQYPASMEDSNV
ncbi:MAG: ThiF family adenylyltransferase [Pseudomonadota bacterium]